MPPWHHQHTAAKEGWHEATSNATMVSLMLRRSAAASHTTAAQLADTQTSHRRPRHRDAANTPPHWSTTRTPPQADHASSGRTPAGENDRRSQNPRRRSTEEADANTRKPPTEAELRRRCTLTHGKRALPRSSRTAAVARRARRRTVAAPAKDEPRRHRSSPRPR